MIAKKTCILIEPIETNPMNRLMATILIGLFKFVIDIHS